MKLSEAQNRANGLVELLRPHCHRIEIAGSIRREVAEVKDIEIVCVPKLARDLFGNPDPNLAHDVRRALETMGATPRENSLGRRIGWGQRFLAGELDGAPIDVFCVLPPAQWGAILAIRTGPADYSRELVTQALRRGMRCVGGRLIVANGGPSDGQEIPTPTEQLFFDALLLDYVEPADRGQS